MKLMKPMFTMMTLGSLLVYAGIREDHKDFSFRAIKVTQGPQTFNDLTQRELASVEPRVKTPAIQYVALNEANRRLINSEWEIMRIVSEEGEEVFNAYSNENDRAIKVDFELLRTSVVQIDKEEGQVYFISLLTEGNTIALFKEYNGGYEILEARRVARRPAPREDGPQISDEVVQSSSATSQEISVADPSLNAELILEKALNPMKTAEVLTGEAISGSASLRGGSIERLSVTLHRGTQNEVSFEMQFAEINDGGQFETLMGDEAVTGILTNSGNEGIRIRFATGPIQGAMLNFVTEEAYEEIQLQREQQEYERMEAEESPIVDEIREQQEEFQNQRAMGQPQITNPGLQQNIYQPPQDGYQEEVLEEYREEQYEDEYEEEAPQDQREVAENGFEF